MTERKSPAGSSADSEQKTGSRDDRVARAVAEQRGWMLDLLERLVRVPTVLGDEEGGQALFEAALLELGLSVREIPMDEEALRADPYSAPFGWEVSSKRNLVGTWSPTADCAPTGDGRTGDGGRSLILGGHIDVVPPAAADLWSSGPFIPWREGDWLYGRGAGDMKGGLVAILGAVRALQELGTEPLAPVHLLSVVEEECTGNGALACMLDGLEADGCVLTEPHYDHITTAQAGVLWFEVEVAGRAAHAGHAELGANAIDGLSAVVSSLQELERELNESPPAPYDRFEHPIHLNVGVIEGGDWPSTVPARARARCRIGLYPGQRPESIRRRVERAVARAGEHGVDGSDSFLAANPATVSYEGFACEGFVLPDEEPLAVTMADTCEETLGSRPPLVPTTATTDARHFVRNGIPAVCFGPDAEQVHGIDERVSISSIEGCARTLAVLIERWCGLRKGPARPEYDRHVPTHSGDDQVVQR